MLLTDDELRELTGRKRTSSQRQVLTALGIDHGVRPDGSLVVLRAVAEQALGLEPERKKDRPLISAGPDWSFA